jgi:hypothetical protein
VIVAHHMGEDLLPQLFATGGAVPLAIAMTRARIALLRRRLRRRR